MRIVSWNVNGLRGIHNRNAFLPALKRLKPDILCLQETKAEQGQAEIDLSEYEEYWNSSSRKKGYAGTAIFTKIEAESTIIDLPKDLAKKYKLDSDGFGDVNAEGRVLTAEFEDFYLVNVYTPNAKPDLGRLKLRHKQWDPAFLAFLKRLEKEKPVIFCGDLNVAHTPDDLARPDQNVGEHGFTDEEREGIDNIIKAGFVDVFRTFHAGKGHYTWWSYFGNARARNVGWRIDYFFVSKSLASKITNAEIHSDVIGSDHCPVSIELK